MIPSEKARYIAVSINPDSKESKIELPTLFAAVSPRLLPSEILENAQHPSPIITAMARAITVSGKTTVFAALP